MKQVASFVKTVYLMKYDTLARNFHQYSKNTDIKINSDF